MCFDFFKLSVSFHDTEFKAEEESVTREVLRNLGLRFRNRYLSE